MSALRNTRPMSILNARKARMADIDGMTDRAIGLAEDWIGGCTNS
jgi:hypothetical protein